MTLSPERKIELLTAVIETGRELYDRHPIDDFIYFAGSDLTAEEGLFLQKINELTKPGGRRL